MTIKLTGDKAMIKLMKQLPNKIARKVARAALIASAKPIVKEAKNNLKPHKRTGALMRSVKAKSAGKTRVGPADEVVILIGPTVNSFYGGFLEFGTSKFQGIHWLRDALESRGDEQRRVLAKEMGVRIMKEVKKLAAKK